MPSTVVLVAVTLSTISLSLAQSDNFLVPQLPDLTDKWVLGQSVDIHYYVSEISFVKLELWHWGLNYISTLQANGTNSGIYTWHIGAGDNVTTAKIDAHSDFVLILYDPNNPNVDYPDWLGGALQSPGFVLSYVHTASNTSAPISAPSTASTTATTTAATATSPTFTSHPATATVSITAKPGGLSTGAAAGIGIGVTAAVLLSAAAIILLCCVRRRKRRDRAAMQEERPVQLQVPTEELHIDLRGKNGHDFPLQSVNAQNVQTGTVSEMGAYERPLELSSGDGRNRRHELHGDS